VKHNDQQAARAAVGGILGFCETWREEIAQCKKYQEEWDEWLIAVGVWKHSGRHGQKPARPEWPSRIPESDNAFSAVSSMESVRDDAIQAMDELDKEKFSGFARFHGRSYALMLIRALDGILAELESKDEIADDGEIDRNQLATLLGVSPGTLKNNPDDLPEPVARNDKQVPIYRYSEVYKKLNSDRHGRADRLPPSFKEAMKRISELSQVSSK